MRAHAACWAMLEGACAKLIWLDWRMQKSATRELSAHAIAGGGVGSLKARWSTFVLEVHLEHENPVQERLQHGLDT